MNNDIVLICDDNISVHKSLEGYLRERNIEPLSAFSGEEALRILRTQEVNLVILDVMLPQMSGIDVLREICRSWEVGVIMLSAKTARSTV